METNTRPRARPQPPVAIYWAGVAKIAIPTPSLASSECSSGIVPCLVVRGARVVLIGLAGQEVWKSTEGSRGMSRLAMIVEDDAVTRWLLGDLFTRRGWEVRLALTVGE